MKWVTGIDLGVCLLPILLASGCGGGSESQSDLVAACKNGVQASCNFVDSPQATIIPLSVSPKELTVSDCTANIPFIFGGGTPPFTILSSDNFGVPVTSATPLGGNNFFLASIGPLASGGVPQNLPTPNIIAEVLTVLDATGHTATVALSVNAVHSACPSNPLLQILPASANARPTEVLGFQITGGSGAVPIVVSKDEKIAKVVGISQTSFQIQAVSAGATLVTVTSGSQNASVTFSVRP